MSSVTAAIAAWPSVIVAPSLELKSCKSQALEYHPEEIPESMDH